MPLIGIVIAAVVATIALAADTAIAERSQPLPFGLTTTVDSARALLSTVAGATITFAGIAFSISLLLIQQASNQYSPRVVHALFRDSFNKRVMALVLGTFTYCLIVLRSVRGALDANGDPFVPSLSVTVATLLGIVTILAIVAFIDHSAHSMDVSEILENVRIEASNHIAHARSSAGADDTADPDEVEAPPDDPALVVTFDNSGWIQSIDAAALLKATPEGSTMWLEAAPGRYAVAGTRICAVDGGPADVAALERAVRGAVVTGTTRTMQQDSSYPLRQLADVALKALSPGINDPTTAQDAIFHLAAVLADLLIHDPPARTVDGPDDRCLVQPQQPTSDELVVLAFGEVRRAAADQPTVCVYLLEAMDLVREVLHGAGLDQRGAELGEQARLVLAGCQERSLLPSDLAVVREAYVKRFGDVRSA